MAKNKADWYINFLEGKTKDLGEVARSGLDFELVPYEKYQNKDAIKRMEEDYLRNAGIYEGEEPPSDELRENLFKTALSDYNRYTNLDNEINLSTFYTKDDPFVRGTGVGPITYQAGVSRDTDNPLMLKKGWSTEEPEREWSIKEIAQQRPFQWNANDKKWEYGSLEDQGFWETFFSPDVATYATHDETIKNDQGKVTFKKGEYKIDPVSGTFFAEGRIGDLSNKQVVSAFDLMTNEGTFWNKVDFFDNDGLESNLIKTIARHGVHYGSYFIPYVGQALLYGELAAGLGNLAIETGKQLEGLVTGESSDWGFLDRYQSGIQQLTFGSAENAGDLSLNGIVDMAGQALLQLKQLKNISQIPAKVEAFKQGKTLEKLMDTNPDLYGKLIKSGSRMGMAYMAAQQAKDVTDWTESLGVTDPRHRALIYGATLAASIGLYFNLPYERWIENSLGLNVDATRFGNVIKKFGLEGLGAKEAQTLVSKTATKAAKDQSALKLGGKIGETFAKASRAANQAKTGIDRAFSAAGKGLQTLSQKSALAARGTTLGAGAVSEGLEEMTEVGLQYGISTLYNGITGGKDGAPTLPTFASGDFWKELMMSGIGGGIGGMVFKAAELPTIKSFDFATIIQNGYTGQALSYIDKQKNEGKLGSTHLSMAQDKNGNYMPVKEGVVGPEGISQNDFMHSLIRESFLKEENLYSQYQAKAENIDELLSNHKMDINDVFGAHTHFSIKNESQKEINFIKEHSEKVRDFEKELDQARTANNSVAIKEAETKLAEVTNELEASKERLRNITSGLKNHEYVREAGLLLRPELARIMNFKNGTDFSSVDEFRDYVTSGKRGEDVRRGIKAIGEWESKNDLSVFREEYTLKPGTTDPGKKKIVDQLTVLGKLNLDERVAFNHRSNLKLDEAQAKKLPSLTLASTFGFRKMMHKFNTTKESFTKGLKALLDNKPKQKNQDPDNEFFPFSFALKIGDRHVLLDDAIRLEGSDTSDLINRHFSDIGLTAEELEQIMESFSDKNIHSLITQYVNKEKLKNNITYAELVSRVRDIFNEVTDYEIVPHDQDFNFENEEIKGELKKALESFKKKINQEIDNFLEVENNLITAYYTSDPETKDVEMGVLFNGFFKIKQEDEDLHFDKFLKDEYTKYHNLGASYIDDTNETVETIERLLADTIDKEAYLYFLQNNKVTNQYLDSRKINDGERFEELLGDTEIEIDDKKYQVNEFVNILKSNLENYRTEFQFLLDEIRKNRENITELLKQSDIKYIKGIVKTLSDGVAVNMGGILNDLQELSNKPKIEVADREQAYAKLFEAAEIFQKNFDPKKFEDFNNFEENNFEYLLPKYQEGLKGLQFENEGFKLAVWNMFHRLGETQDGKEPVNSLRNIYKALREHMKEHEEHYAPFAPQELLGIIQIVTKLFNPSSYIQSNKNAVDKMLGEGFMNVADNSIFVDSPGGAGKSKVIGKTAISIYHKLIEAGGGTAKKTAVFASGETQVETANSSFDTLNTAENEQILKTDDQTFRGLKEFVLNSEIKSLYKDSIGFKGDGGKGRALKRNLKDNTNISPSYNKENLDKVDSIVIDEATNLNASEIVTIAKAVQNYNTEQRGNIRIIFMGDSYQIGKVYSDGKKVVSDNFEFLNIERTVRMNKSLRAGESNIREATESFERILNAESAGMIIGGNRVTGAEAMFEKTETEPIKLFHDVTEKGLIRGIRESDQVDKTINETIERSEEDETIGIVVTGEEKLKYETRYEDQIQKGKVKIRTVRSIQSDEFDYVFVTHPVVKEPVNVNGDITMRVKTINTLVTRSKKAFIHVGLGLDKMRTEGNRILKVQTDQKDNKSVLVLDNEVRNSFKSEKISSLESLGDIEGNLPKSLKSASGKIFQVSPVNDMVKDIYRKSEDRAFLYLKDGVDGIQNNSQLPFKSHLFYLSPSSLEDGKKLLGTDTDIAKKLAVLKNYYIKLLSGTKFIIPTIGEDVKEIAKNITGATTDSQAIRNLNRMLSNGELVFKSYGRDVASQHHLGDPNMTNKKLNVPHNVTTLALRLKKGDTDYTIDLFSIASATSSKKDSKGNDPTLEGWFNSIQTAMSEESKINPKTAITEIKEFHDRVKEANQNQTEIKIPFGNKKQLIEYIASNLYKGQRYTGDRSYTLGEVMNNSDYMTFSKPFVITGLGDNTHPIIKQHKGALVVLYSYTDNTLNRLNETSLSNKLETWAKSKEEVDGAGLKSDIGMLIIEPKHVENATGDSNGAFEMMESWVKAIKHQNSTFFKGKNFLGNRIKANARQKEGLIPSPVRIKMVQFMNRHLEDFEEFLKSDPDNLIMVDQSLTDEQKDKAVRDFYKEDGYSKLSKLDLFKMFDSIEGGLTNQSDAQKNSFGDSIDEIFKGRIPLGYRIDFDSRNRNLVKEKVNIATIQAPKSYKNADFFHAINNARQITAPAFNVSLDKLNYFSAGAKTEQELAKLRTEYTELLDRLKKLQNDFTDNKFKTVQDILDRIEQIRQIFNIDKGAPNQKVKVTGANGKFNLSLAIQAYPNLEDTTKRKTVKKEFVYHFQPDLTANELMDAIRSVNIKELVSFEDLKHTVSKLFPNVTKPVPRYESTEVGGKTMVSLYLRDPNDPSDSEKNIIFDLVSVTNVNEKPLKIVVKQTSSEQNTTEQGSSEKNTMSELENVLGGDFNMLTEQQKNDIVGHKEEGKTGAPESVLLGFNRYNNAVYSRKDTDVPGMISRELLEKIQNKFLNCG